MKMKIILLTVLILSGSFLGISAQVLDGYVKSKARTAQNRAVYDADKEVDNQINKAVDKEFDKLKNKILDKDKKKNEGETDSSEVAEPAETVEVDNSKSKAGSSSDDAMSKAMMGKMGISMERPANMKDNYDFTGNIKMDVETWNDDGESEGVIDYTTQYSDKNNGFAMEFKDEDNKYSTMIFDYDNMLMLILGDDGSEKNGFASPLGAFQSDSISAASGSETNSEEVENYYSGFKKTGKTKNIAGYACEEYYFEDEESKISYWMTSELPKELWAKMGSSSVFTSLYTGQTNGFVMESDHQYKASKERSHMIVKEVNKNQPARISTVGYNVMTMNVNPSATQPAEKGKKSTKK